MLAVSPRFARHWVKSHALLEGPLIVPVALPMIPYHLVGDDGRPVLVLEFDPGPQRARQCPHDRPLR